jgi:hypothetical protein
VGSRAARCDEVEYAAGAGPCVTALDTMQVVLVPDIAADPRWPEWRAAALAAGFRSAAGVPAHVADGVEVALNLYAEDPAHLDRSLLVRADAYLQHVAVTIDLCLQVAHLTTAHADDQGRLRELEAINRLVVAAVTDDCTPIGTLHAVGDTRPPACHSGDVVGHRALAS